MKTTIELPDRLFAEAKAVAARRRSTLKALITHALEREIRFAPLAPPTDVFEVDGDGLPRLPRRGVLVSSECVHRLMDEEASVGAG